LFAKVFLDKKKLQTAMKLVVKTWQKAPSRLLRQRSEEIKRYYQQLLANTASFLPSLPFHYSSMPWTCVSRENSSLMMASMCSFGSQGTSA